MMRCTELEITVQHNADSVVKKVVQKKFRPASKSRPAKGFFRGKNLNEATATIFNGKDQEVHDKFFTRRQRVRDAFAAGDLIEVMSDNKKVTKYKGESWPTVAPDEKTVLIGYRTLTARERRLREASLHKKRERGAGRSYARKHHGASRHANTRQPVTQRA